MSDALKKAVYDALDTISSPYGGGTIRQAGLVSAVIIDGTNVGIVLDFGDRKPENTESLRAKVEAIAQNVEGIATANVVITSARPAAPAPTLERKAPPPPTPTPIEGVKNIIAVASGKGGVGKSTTSVNLALALQSFGLKVGVLDADIFGPSLPTLLGAKGRPEIENKIMQPVIAQGLKIMSIGFLLDIDQPVVWRGPRVMGATQQLLKEVAWGPLDVLIVDMPPGTGDVQLTMVQQAPLSGAVIVSTPQDLALIDARKGLAMFRKVGVPIVGVIENMSSFHCPHCGTESHIFGHGGAEEAAAELGQPFLGHIPLDMAVRANSDAGTPIVTKEPDNPISQAYKDIAAKVHATLKL